MSAVATGGLPQRKMMVLPLRLWGLMVVAAAGAATAPGCGPGVVNLFTPVAQDAAVDAVYRDDDWATVLAENVADGLVNYVHLYENRSPLNAYLELLAVVGPRSAPGQFKARSSRLAYYINAYNACVLRVVLWHMQKLSAEVPTPPPTMHDVRLRPLEYGFRFLIDREQVTLATLREHARSESNGDARIELALCAAARGSPPLLGEPYRTELLDRTLRRVAAEAMDNVRLVRLDHDEQRLMTAVVFFQQRDRFIEYFRGQTGARSASLLDVLMHFAQPRRREWLGRAARYDHRVIPFDRRLNSVTAGV